MSKKREPYVGSWQTLKKTEASNEMFCKRFVRQLRAMARKGPVEVTLERTLLVAHGK